MLAADRSAESAGRLENLTELARAMEEYETLGAFLEHVSLAMDNDEARAGEKVTIMTIHAAKGLEFDRVFLPGWEEGLFPSQRSMDEGGLASLEEERRLAYVAITRARRAATILHARSEEHTSELQSLMRIPYAVFCVKKNHHKRPHRPSMLQNTRLTIVLTQSHNTTSHI